MDTMPPAAESGAVTTRRPPLALAVIGAGLLLIPLARSRWLEDSYTTPKLCVALACTLTVLLVAFIRQAVRPSAAASPTVSPSGWLLLGLLGWHATTLLWAPSKALTAYALAYWAAMLAWFFACRFALRTASDVVYAARWLVLATVMTAAWTLAEDATGGAVSGIVQARLPDWRGHLSAGLGNSGHIAGLIGLALPFVVITALARGRLQVWPVLALVPLFAALVVTWSIGSTGGAVIALALWALVATLTPARPDIVWPRIVAIVAVGIVATGFYMLPHPLNPHAPSLWTEAFSSERWKEGGPTRIAIWLTTWHMIKSAPLLGVGFGNFTYEYVRQIVPSVQSDPDLAIYAGAFTNDAHDEYLHLWAEGGLLSLCLYAALMARFLYVTAGAARRSDSSVVRLAAIAVGAAGTSFFLDSIMTFPLRLPAHHAVFMFLLAAGECLHRTDTVSAVGGPPASSRVPRLHGTLLAALLILTLISAWKVGMRGAAEYWLKLGRMRAESVAANFEAGSLPPWYAGEQAVEQATAALASGDKEQFVRLFAQASRLSRNPTMEIAEARFHKALSFDPRYSNASSRLGALLLMQGRADEAIEALSATMLDLQSPEIYQRLGLAYYLTGDIQEAQALWLTAADRRPAMAEYLRALAISAGRAQ